MIDKSSFPVEFLPLNYFIEILMHLESSNQGNPFLCSQEFALTPQSFPSHIFVLFSSLNNPYKYVLSKVDFH